MRHPKIIIRPKGRQANNMFQLDWLAQPQPVALMPITRSYAQNVIRIYIQVMVGMGFSI